MTEERTALEEERRLVTVLFADLVGYTTVSEAHDPELMQEALNLCFDRLSAEIGRFGGYVDKVVGDEIMALFGAPRAQEDDAGKAVAAALAMRRSLEELTPQLQDRLGQGFSMRVGINTGLVVTGAVGPGGYTVTGDAVNVSARLEKAAEPGAVLVGESTRRLARRQFQWGDRQEFAVKGRTEPVVCYTVEGLPVAPLRLVPAPSETPFVGRDEHLEQIREDWAATEAGSARVLRIEGEAGIGKTRLLAHLFATAGTSPEQVLYTRADTPPRTFGPLVQLLPSLRENLPQGFLERVEALARVHEVAEPPDVEPDWLVDGLAEVIGALAAAGPVALVLDDMHRADSGTVDVVERLLPRLAALPVLTLLLRQPTGRRLRRLSTTDSFALDTLSEQQARSLAHGVAQGLSEATVTEIVSQAGGNPLYLEVLAAATSAAPEGARIPESLQTAVVARVDELDETSRQVLREASVFGQSFYEEPLKLTTTVSEGLYEALAHLCEVGLLDELPDVRQRGYQFRHSLVQQVLYEGLLRRQRADLHLRAAESLELVQEEGMEVEPEQLAFHFRGAGHSERAASYHLEAGERADRLRAPSEATNHRRAANRLLNMASLAGLYGVHGQPTAAARVGAGVLQALLAVALFLPLFLLFATRRPEPDLLTLGLPLEIIDFNLSSVLLAIALGGLPLLAAGIAFTHLAVPVLMQRTARAPTLVGIALGGWLLGLVFVLIGYGALVGLLRIDALDRLSSIYVGGATLQLLRGDYSLLVTTAIGTLVVAVAWTALLRLQSRGWARLRRSSVGPRQIEEGRRWAALRQLGLLIGGAGALAAALLAAYQFEMLPSGEMQAALPSGAFSGLLFLCGAMVVFGAAAAWLATRRLQAKAAAHELGFFGFEVPLFLAIAFGLVAWFGMRQSVVVGANDVDTPTSLAPFDRAISLFPDFDMAYYIRGEQHLARWDYVRAEADLDRAIELDPEFPASYLARSRVRIARGDYSGAAEDATRIIELRPDHPGGYALRAWAGFAMGDLAAGSEDLSTATRPLPDTARAWDAFFVRCLTLAGIGRSEEALLDCQNVVRLNPSHIPSREVMASIYYDQGDYEASLEQYDRILEALSAEAPVIRIRSLTGRGTVYRYLDRFQEAEGDLDVAIDLAAGGLDQAIEPDTDLDTESAALAYRERGIVRVFLDDRVGAFADADRSVALLRDQLTLGARYWVALYTAHYQTAVEDADAVLTMGRPSAAAHNNRGLAYALAGDLERALADLDRALEMDPGLASASENRGFAHYLAGDHEQALADLDRALQGLPALSPQKQAELHFHRALVLAEIGRSETALEELSEAERLVEIPSVREQILEARAELEEQR